MREAVPPFRHTSSEICTSAKRSFLNFYLSCVFEISVLPTVREKPCYYKCVNIASVRIEDFHESYFCTLFLYMNILLNFVLSGNVSHDCVPIFLMFRKITSAPFP